jgi:hypothetical protein
VSTPTLKFGKYSGVALPSVPAAYLAFMLTKEDLWPETRQMIEAEVKRRANTAPAKTTGEDAEPLDARLRGDEERVIASRCPRCGHGLSVFVRLTR